jgi:hypothetical protein
VYSDPVLDGTFQTLCCGKDFIAAASRSLLDTSPAHRIVVFDRKTKEVKYVGAFGRRDTDVGSIGWLRNIGSGYFAAMQPHVPPERKPGKGDYLRDEIPGKASLVSCTGRVAVLFKAPLTQLVDVCVHKHRDAYEFVALLRVSEELGALEWYGKDGSVRAKFRFPRTAVPRDGARAYRDFDTDRVFHSPSAICCDMNGNVVYVMCRDGVVAVPYR